MYPLKDALECRLEQHEDHNNGDAEAEATGAGGKRVPTRVRAKCRKDGRYLRNADQQPERDGEIHEAIDDEHVRATQPHVERSEIDFERDFCHVVRQSEEHRSRVHEVLQQQHRRQMLEEALPMQPNEQHVEQHVGAQSEHEHYYVDPNIKVLEKRPKCLCRL